jgi:hypothetical protein
MEMKRELVKKMTVLVWTLLMTAFVNILVATVKAPAKPGRNKRLMVFCGTELGLHVGYM